MSPDDRPSDDLPQDPGSALDAGFRALFFHGRTEARAESALDKLENPIGSVPRVMLRTPAGEGPEGVVQLGSDELPGDAGGRYQILGEIARGGMGVVARGRDTDLGRDLALKVLLQRHRRKPELLQRFVEEAQIGGQLQHPGIVPVYELGQFAGGRPYFTMKLVKGQTLAALLAERSSPEEDQARYLRIFEQVCQTLAYAHARGVIHRDLKPSNVMVGAFGEVQVMDWGLAKVLKEGGIEDERKAKAKRAAVSVIQTARSEGSAGSDTQAGSVMGTPAYMAPEQARGEVESVDERADVFGLGAVLCEILTGDPPFRGSTAEAQRRSERGEVGDCHRRIDAAPADAEIRELAKRCLAAEVSDRPRHAGEVAEEISRHRESVEARLRAAELERAAEKARAEEAQVRALVERRARRVTLALSAAALVAILLGGAGWLWVKGEREARLAKARSELEGALERAGALLDQSQKAPAEDLSALSAARVEADRARSVSRDTGAVLDANRRKLLDAIEEEWKDRQLLIALDQARLAGAIQMFAPERTLLGYRDGFRAWGLEPGKDEVAAAAALICGRPPRVVGEVCAALDDWIRLAAAQPRPVEEPHLAWLEQLVAAADRDSWRKAVREAAKEAEVSLRAKRFRGLSEEADVSSQPVAALHGLATRFIDIGEWDAATALLRRAWRRTPGDFWINLSLGYAWQKSQPPQYEKAATFFAMAVAARPKSAGALMNLGVALVYQGNAADALRIYERALQLSPGDRLLQANLAAALISLGRVAEGIASFENLIEADSKLFQAHQMFGVALIYQGRIDEGIASLRRGVELAPRDDQGWWWLGRGLSRLKRFEEAADAYRKLIGLSPRHVGAHFNLAAALEGLGRLEDAAAEYQKALELDPALAIARTNLATILDRQGRLEEALAQLGKALEAKPDLLEAHLNRGSILSSAGRHEEAAQAYREAVLFHPANVNAPVGLGGELLHLGKPDEAAEALRGALAIDADNAMALTNLGTVLTKQGKAKEAEGLYRRSLEKDSANAITHYSLGNLLADEERFDEAIDCYDKAIAIDPSDPETHCNRGHALHGAGRWTESLAALRRGHELGSKLEGWSYPSAEWVANAERLAKIEGRLEAVLDGRDARASADDLLVLSDLAAKRRRFADAARLVERSLSTTPELPDPRRQVNRWYQGAWTGVLAGTGRDAKPLPAAERADFRAKALRWMRSALKSVGGHGPEAGEDERNWRQGFLAHALKDPGLEGVRAEQALATLPPEEADAWRTPDRPEPVPPSPVLTSALNSCPAVEGLRPHVGVSGVQYSTIASSG